MRGPTKFRDLPPGLAPASATDDAIYQLKPARGRRHSIHVRLAAAAEREVWTSFVAKKPGPMVCWRRRSFFDEW